PLVFLTIVLGISVYIRIPCYLPQTVGFYSVCLSVGDVHNLNRVIRKTKTKVGCGLGKWAIPVNDYFNIFCDFPLKKVGFGQKTDPEKNFRIQKTPSIDGWKGSEWA